MVCGRYLLSQSVSVDAPDSAGRTAVHHCSEHGHLSLLLLLLAASASPRTADHAGWTPLHCAALGAWPMHESHREVITALLEAGADVHAREAQGLTPLHVCTDTPAARRLLKAGADITATDSSGRMPLHYASHENSMSAQASTAGATVSARRRCSFILSASAQHVTGSRSAGGSSRSVRAVAAASARLVADCLGCSQLMPLCCALLCPALLMSQLPADPVSSLH